MGYREGTRNRVHQTFRREVRVRTSLPLRAQAIRHTRFVCRAALFVAQTKFGSEASIEVIDRSREMVLN